MFPRSSIRTFSLLLSAAWLSGCTIYPIAGAYYIAPPADADTSAALNTAMPTTAQLQPASDAGISRAVAIGDVGMATDSIFPTESDPVTTATLASAQDSNADLAVTIDPEADALALLPTPSYDYSALSSVIVTESEAENNTFTTGSIPSDAPEGHLVTGSKDSRDTAFDVDTTWGLRLLYESGRASQ